MRKTDCANTKELWEAVKSKRNSTSIGLGDINSVNYFFAKISHDDKYVSPAADNTVRPVDKRVRASTGYTLEPYVIQKLLSQIKSTASGFDNIPSWVFAECSYELADIVSHIFKCSITQGVIPDQWRTAIVSPIPKISCPSGIQDFRPISVTPILSRVLEKIVVKDFIRPNLDPELLKDQFAFRPTGSTTAALVALMHHVTRLLENNSYVRCLLIDFSKAFDVVNYVFY